MSQAKVDKYKEEKANRRKIMKREKRMHRLEMSAVVLVVALMIGWIGFSVHDKMGNKENTKETVIFNTNPIQDYLTQLNAE